jgi:uncharacterized membrane protein
VLRLRVLKEKLRESLWLLPALRAVVPRVTWGGWVGVALHEIVDDGGGSANVCHRLLRLLDDLIVSLPAHRRPVLRRFAEEVRGLGGTGGAYAQWDELEATSRPGEPTDRDRAPGPGPPPRPNPYAPLAM